MIFVGKQREIQILFLYKLSQLGHRVRAHTQHNRIKFSQSLGDVCLLTRYDQRE